MADRFYYLYSNTPNHPSGVNAGFSDLSVKWLSNTDSAMWFILPGNPIPRTNGIGPLFDTDSGVAVLYFDEQ